MSGIPLFGGLHDCIFFGPRDNPKRDKYWAERGLIHHEDTVTGEFQTIVMRDWLLRLQGVNDMLGRSKKAAEDFVHGDEFGRNRKFVEEGVALANKAREQGLAGTEEGIKQARARKPVSVVVPGHKHQF